MAITLSDISTVAHVKAPKSKRPNVFGIFSPSKNYRVQAPSQAEADSWVDHIRRECAFEHTERESEYIPKQRIPVMDVEESAWEMSDHDGHGGDNLSSIPHNTASILRSNLLEVSGNDITSCSDLSDVPPRSVPYRSLGYLDRLDHNMQPLRTQVDRQPSLRRHASHHSDKESRNTNPERVVFNGYLFCLKNKKGVRQWNKYWVVLRAEKLALYKNDQEYSAIRIIPLDQVVDAADIDPISRSKVFCFQLITEGATYRFCAPDEEALDHWLGSLKSVLTRVHERPHYERPVRALPGSSVGTR